MTLKTPLEQAISRMTDGRTNDETMTVRVSELWSLLDADWLVPVPGATVDVERLALALWHERAGTAKPPRPESANWQEQRERAARLAAVYARLPEPDVFDDYEPEPRKP